jgi:uncharacterized membrane protein required for colicin V production
MVICLLAIMFGYFGIKRGFIGEIFRFAAVLGGFLVSFLYYRDLQAVMKGFASNEYVVATTAFIVLFLAVYAVIALIGFFLKEAVSALTLGWADCVLGMLVGLLKAAVIAWAVCISVASFDTPKAQNEFDRSVVYRTYKAMPRFFSLEGMEDKRKAILGRGGSEKPKKAKGLTGDEAIDEILTKDPP